MSTRGRIYGPADVAAALGVSRPAVTNWNRRGLDTPPPDHVTIDGRAYWYDLTPWREWHTARALAAAERAAEVATEAAEAADRLAARLAEARTRAERAADRAAELDARAQVVQHRHRLAEPD